MKLTDFGMMASLAIIVSVAVLVSLQPAYAQTADYTDRTSENLFVFQQGVETTNFGAFIGPRPVIFNQNIPFSNVTIASTGGPYNTPYIGIIYSGIVGNVPDDTILITQTDVTVPKGFTIAGDLSRSLTAGGGQYVSFDCDADKTTVIGGSPVRYDEGHEIVYTFDFLPYARQITLTNTDGTTNSPAGDLLDYNVCIAPEGLHDNHNYIFVPRGSPDRFITAYAPPTGWEVTADSQSTVTLITPDDDSAITQYQRVVLVPEPGGDLNNINATGNELLAEATNFIRYTPPASGNLGSNGLSAMSFEAPFFNAPATPTDPNPAPSNPAVTISSTTANDNGSTDSQTITYTATFTEDVTGFDDSSDITLSGTAIATVAAPTGSGTTYTFVVTASTDGTVIVSIPASVAMDADSNGNTASDTYTVTIAPPTANPQTIFGSMGSGDGQFDNPRGIAVNSTRILVVDRDNDRVQTFDHSGTYLSQFGDTGPGNAQFTTPQGITTNSTHILVADQQNDRIQIFDHSGNYVSQFGGTGTGNGQFDGPNGITTNSTHILVADSNNDRIQILDHSGNYVDQFGSTGTGDGQFDTPHGITTNSIHILVADSNNDRIQIFDHSGNYVSQFGSSGTENGQFNTPRGIAVTSTHILVTDELNHRIQTFDLAGNYVNQFGSEGTENGQFTNPYGIDIEGDNVFVSDTVNHRIHIYGLAMIVTPDTGGGSGGNIAQSRPHFGMSPLTDTQLVSCGFSMDGECRDVVDYHVPYDRTVIQTGTTHDFTLKPFNNYNLKMLQLGLGVEEVGDSINTAEALIVVELELDYKSDIGYAVESVMTENNLEDVIDEVTESNVSLSTEPCMTGLKKDCLVVHINDVMFRDVFYSEPFVINVVDTKRLSSTNYLNEGIIVTGESLNPAPEYHLTTGKKVQQVVERLNLVRTDKVNDIWTDNNGNQWTQNSHDTWIQVTFTPYVEPQDPTMSVMTRINNNFDGIIQFERERAILVWDGAMIQGEIKPSFSYTFDEKLDKLDDPKILKKMHIESEKALEILRAAGYYSTDE